MMGANNAVEYQNPTHVHAESDVANLTTDLAAKTAKVTSDAGSVRPMWRSTR